MRGRYLINFMKTEKTEKFYIHADTEKETELTMLLINEIAESAEIVDLTGEVELVSEAVN